MIFAPAYPKRYAGDSVCAHGRRIDFRNTGGTENVRQDRSDAPGDQGE